MPYLTLSLAENLTFNIIIFRKCTEILLTWTRDNCFTLAVFGHLVCTLLVTAKVTICESKIFTDTSHSANQRFYSASHVYVIY